MEIEFKRLSGVEKADLIALMNHPLVRRQMPLTSDNFDRLTDPDFLQDV